MRSCGAVIACLILLCCVKAAPQSAQIFMPETDGWRVHVGDDPAWASPSFDDSSWTRTNLDMATIPREVLAGRSRWFRKRIQLPPEPGAMQVLVSTYGGSYEVYVDGRLISPPIEPAYTWRAHVTRIFPLPLEDVAARRDVEVAIRSHLYQQVYFVCRPPFVGVGSPARAAEVKSALDGRVLGANVALITVNLLMLLAGGILLSLYLQQLGQREYLWLGLSVLFSGLANFIVNAQAYIPNSWNAFLGDPCEFWFFAALIQFVYVSMGRQPHRALRLYQWALIAVPFVTSPVGWSGSVNIDTFGWLEDAIILPGAVVPLLQLIVWARRGNREAAVLIGPILLANLSFLLGGLEEALKYLRPGYPGFQQLQLGLASFDYVSVTQAIFLLAIGFVMFLRFVRVSREQVRTQAELEAARAVQQVLIPDKLPTVAGFRIDSVYHPAQQVGGDFFQVVPLDDGEVLAVVGDVSGKGMPAALTVALIVGTLRTLVESTSSPAAMLAGLNRRLAGRSTGFTTCVAARLRADGEVTLANAGHLNPYVSSSERAPREIVVSPGLPLGLTADSQYADMSIALAPGETITFLSDGVVEARNARGELFGFDRACSLAALSAGQIAQTAEAFGQEDDITVVTVSMIGAAVPAQA